MERALTPPPVLALRVVADGTERDLLVPGDVPVVELLAELVGPGTDPAGTGTTGTGRPRAGRLVRVDGSPVRAGAGLREQGVRDGTVLVLVPDLGPEDHDAVDDPVDAVGAALTRAEARSVARSGVPSRAPSGTPSGAPRSPSDGASVERPLLVGLLGALAAASLVTATPSPSGATLVVVLAGVLAALTAGGGVLAARVTGDAPTAASALGASALVATATVLPGAPSLAAMLGRAAALLALCALALALAFPARRDAALGPALAALVGLGAAGALHLAPVTAAQVAVVVLCVAALSVRAVPWVAVASAGVDQATAVLPAGRRRPGSSGGADLPTVAAAVDRARRVARAATWGLGAVAAVAAAPVGGSGRGGLLLVGCLGALLAGVERDTETGLRTARRVTGAAVLGSGWLGAVAHRPGSPPVPSTVTLVVTLVVVLATLLLVLGTSLSPDRPSAVALGGVEDGVLATLVGRVRPAIEVVALVAVPALVACTLGLLPLPAGWP